MFFFNPIFGQDSSTTLTVADTIVKSDSVAKPVINLVKVNPDSAVIPANPLAIFTLSNALKDSSQANLGNHSPIVKEPHLSQIPRQTKKNTAIFFYLVGLWFLLGLIKKTQSNFLSSVFKNFGSITLSKRQLKIQNPSYMLPRVLMDIFCFLSIGYFIFQTAHHLNRDQWMAGLNPWWLILGVPLIVAFFNGLKNLASLFFGWLFQIEILMEYYRFNLNMFNHVLGVFLLPISCIITFAQGKWVQVVFTFSLVVILILFIIKYIRSGQVYRYFFNLSKFHFILYLCAFEILPLAILIKLANAYLIN